MSVRIFLSPSDKKEPVNSLITAYVTLDDLKDLRSCSRDLKNAELICCNYSCLLVGASVADAAVPVGEWAFAAGLVRSCLRPLSLPPLSGVAGCRPPSFRPSGDTEAEALLGEAWSPICFFRSCREKGP
jgi:hypothetical protein